MTSKRYQVFLSSTFSDLEPERIEVTQALLKMQRCIPAGMEMFPASGLPPWEVIAPVIDVTDYFVLVIAGRYGSTLQDGTSYTEREYEYAHSHGIPVLAFIHSSPDDIPFKFTEDNVASRERLRQFREKVEQRHTVQGWTTSAELAQKVAASLWQAFDAQPRPGWVRGNQGPPPAPSGTFSEGVDKNPLALSLEAPGAFEQVEEAVAEEVDKLLSLPALSRRAETVNVQDAPTEHRNRVQQIEEAAGPLLMLLGRIGRSGKPEANQLLLDLIPELSPNVRLSGLTAFIDLLRAPGVLSFYAAGVGACVGNRDTTAGLLLGDASRNRGSLQRRSQACFGPAST